MSLSLIQSYSSADEEEDQVKDFTSSDEDDDTRNTSGRGRLLSYKSVYEQQSANLSASNSGLPSASDAFTQISGPPKFLNNIVEEQQGSAIDVENQTWRHGRHRRNRKNKKELPAGVVLEAKAQLVGIHERVRSDIEANQPPASSVPSTKEEGGKRVVTVANPNAEDAAELLRMCLQCGIPKTFSSARGMVCPVCGDRPPNDSNQEQKKKGSTVKDKEKSKRMKGQSSHATWKSETEMQLRQQFD